MSPPGSNRATTNLMAAKPSSSAAGNSNLHSESQASHSQVEFAGELKRSGLLTHKQFVDAVTLCKQHVEPANTARQLVQHGLLTSFQAGQILMGQGHWLALGDYRVLRPLSDGGVGRVYLGYDTQNRQKVAIKMLRESRRNNPRAVQRFRVEAHALLALNHKNLLRGLAYEKASPERRQPAYLVTDFVEGPNLRELLAIRRQLPWEVVCDMIAQAASGLHHAHQNRFVHRDIKPSNLMALASGRVNVIDFGMVRYCGDDPDWFSPPPVKLGFADFLAPEQLADREHVDGRADIYSLGCTMFYLLTGRAPIKFAPRNAPPPSLRKHRDDAPPELEKVLNRMLAAETDERYQSMAEVHDELQPLARRASLIIDYPALLRARVATVRAAEPAAPEIRQLTMPTIRRRADDAVPADEAAPATVGAAAAAAADASVAADTDVPSLADTQLQRLERLVSDLSRRLIDSQQALAVAEAKIDNDARLAAQQLAAWRAEKESLLKQLEASEARRLQAEQQQQALLERIEKATSYATAMADSVAVMEHRLAEQNEDLSTLKKAYDDARESLDAS